jgi:hypothetical protein
MRRWAIAAGVLGVAAVIALVIVRREQPRVPVSDAQDAGRVAEPTPAEPPATAAARAALGGLGPGDPVGGFVVVSVSDPVRGALVIRTREGPVFEVRLVSEDQPPPASARGVGVYYRNMRIGSSYPPEDLEKAAQAIAARIDSAAAPIPAGLTALLPDPGQPL